MTHLQRRPSVAALVVTYRPDASVVERLERIKPQVDRLFVVDNGSPARLADPIREWLERAGGTFIANDRNMGVGVALNQGARAAIGAGADWLLTLDQDTNPPADLVEQLFGAVAAWDSPTVSGSAGRRPIISATPAAETRRRQCGAGWSLPRAACSRSPRTVAVARSARTTSSTWSRPSTRSVSHV